MQEMGAKVTQLPGGEIVPAMDRGVIDAFEYNNPTSDRRFGAQDVAKNYMLGSFHQAMEFFEIGFNRKKHDALPKDLQAILRYSAEAASSSNWWTAMDNYSRDLDALINQDKVNVYRTPKSVFEAQIKAWDVVAKRLSDEDPFFKKVVESQRPGPSAWPSTCSSTKPTISSATSTSSARSRACPEIAAQRSSSREARASLAFGNQTMNDLKLTMHAAPRGALIAQRAAGRALK
jgi:hypothetical protein